MSRKKKLLELVNRKELTAEKYKNTLEVYCKRLAGYIFLNDRTDFATDYKFELDGIADFHEGNVQSWFSEILEETQFSL